MNLGNEPFVPKPLNSCFPSLGFRWQSLVASGLSWFRKHSASTLIESQAVAEWKWALPWVSMVLKATASQSRGLALC